MHRELAMQAERMLKAHREHLVSVAAGLQQLLDAGTLSKKDVSAVADIKAGIDNFDPNAKAVEPTS